jgi:hypothetical protein
MSFVNAAVFAVGAVVGGGVTAAVVSQRRQLPPPPTTLPAGKTVTLPPSIVQVGPSGDAQLITPGASVGTVEPVLKYGHPGEFAVSCQKRSVDFAKVRSPTCWSARVMSQAMTVACGIRRG